MSASSNLLKFRKIFNFNIFSFSDIQKRPKIICFGNVLLDIVFKCTDDFVLKKHKLRENDQKEVPIEELQRLSNDAKKR